MAYETLPPASRSALVGVRSLYLGTASPSGRRRGCVHFTMRVLLRDDPDGQKAQALATSLCFTQSERLLRGSERAVEAYARHQPQSSDDRYRMEL